MAHAVKLQISRKKQIKILMNLFKDTVLEPENCMDFVLKDGKDLYNWYVRIFGLCGNFDEYVGGEYIFELVVPKNYPQQVFSFRCLTPNGFYMANGTPICISIGEYHQNDTPGGYSGGNRDHGYAPAKSGGPKKFVREVINGMIIGHKDLNDNDKNNKGMKGGINIEFKTPIQKKVLAAASKEFNLKHLPHIMALFNDLRVNKIRRLVDSLETMYPDLEKEYLIDYKRSIKKYMGIPIDC